MVMNAVSSEGVVVPETRPVDELAHPPPAGLEGLIAADGQRVFPNAVKFHHLSLGELVQHPFLDVLFHFGRGALPAPAALARHALGGPAFDVLAWDVQFSADFGHWQFLLKQKSHCYFLLLLRIALVGAAFVAAFADRLSRRLFFHRFFLLFSISLLQFHFCALCPMSRVSHFNGGGRV